MTKEKFEEAQDLELEIDKANTAINAIKNSDRCMFYHSDDDFQCVLISKELSLLKDRAIEIVLARLNQLQEKFASL